MSHRTAEERTRTLFNYLSEIDQWARFMDRVFFRQNLKLLCEFMEEEGESLEFTTTEQKEWEVIQDAAFQENQPESLYNHMDKIHGFWRAYQSNPLQADTKSISIE